MPRASEVLAALQRDGWEEIRTSSSHHILRKGRRTRTLAFHYRVDLGKVRFAQVARDFGYTVEQLRKLL